MTLLKVLLAGIAAVLFFMAATTTLKVYWAFVFIYWVANAVQGIKKK